MQQMIKWLKQFWYDMGNLNRGDFLLKYVLPFFCVFLLWGLIGSTYTSNINLNSLIVNEGVVTNITILRHHKGYHIEIKLDNNDNDFLVPNNFKNQFQKIESEISIGDNIKLYTRNYYQTFIGWGRKNDIYQIEKNDKIIFHLDSVKKSKQGLSKITGYSLLFFLTLYVIYKIKKKGKKNRKIKGSS